MGLLLAPTPVSLYQGRVMTDTSSTDSAEATAPRSFAALRHPGFRIYFIGTMLAMMADSIEHAISYWVIFAKFASPGLQGFAVISHWVPFLLFSIYAGALCDRFDPRRIIQIGMGMFIFASLGWGVLFFYDGLEQWHAVVLLIVHGLAGVLWGPAAQLLIHDIVGAAHLQSGVRLLAGARTLGVLLGPVVGGALMLWLGPALAILINAAIYLPLTLWLWKAPYGPKFRSAEEAPRQPIRGLMDIIETIKHVQTLPRIMYMTLLGGVAALLVGIAFQALLPAFATALGAERAENQYFMLLTANAAGALTAVVVLEGGGLLQARVRTAFVLVLLWGCFMTAFALSRDIVLSTALLFVAGFVHFSYGAMLQTLVQLEAPREARGRFIGLYNMSALGLMSFSGLTIGVFGEFVGIRWSLGLSSGLLVAAVLILYAMIRRRGAVPGLMS